MSSINVRVHRGSDESLLFETSIAVNPPPMFVSSLVALVSNRLEDPPHTFQLMRKEVECLSILQEGD